MSADTGRGAIMILTKDVLFGVSIRNAAPGTSFGYRVITSDAVYRPTNIEQFSGTLREASRLLGQLRQLPPGQSWSQDMGRTFIIPNLQGPSVRTFMPKSLDSLRTWAESLRIHHPTARDSLIDH